jgi:hypothetical protein
MKFKVDIDCTPEEARSFLGLPDVKPMQEVLLDQIQAQMSASLAAMEPEALMRNWMPGGPQGLEQLQKMFWGLATGTGKTKT